MKMLELWNKKVELETIDYNFLSRLILKDIQLAWDDFIERWRIQKSDFLFQKLLLVIFIDMAKILL